MSQILQVTLCLIIAGLMLYRTIDNLNALTELRLAIPVIKREIAEIKEKNLQLQYAIDSFENPLHLMELARKPEYSHLKYPKEGEVIAL